MSAGRNENCDDCDVNRQSMLLQEQFNDHVDEFHKHVEDFHQHRKEYQAYREEEAERWDHLLTSQAENAKAQVENTKAIHELAESSRDLLEAWQAATGTVKVLSALGKFIKWLSGFSVIAVFIAWIMEHGK